MKNFPDLPPVWLAGFLVANWAIARFVPGNYGVSFSGILGWGLIGAGLGMIAWSAVWFWRRKTTIEPHHIPTKLIIEGPYRVSRNPIYLGMVVILIGAVIGRGQPLALLLVPVFVSVLTRRFILPEEDGLHATFGAEAVAYLSRTRRWI